VNLVKRIEREEEGAVLVAENGLGISLRELKESFFQKHKFLINIRESR